MKDNNSLVDQEKKIGTSLLLGPVKS